MNASTRRALASVVCSMRASDATCSSARTVTPFRPWLSTRMVARSTRSRPATSAARRRSSSSTGIVPRLWPTRTGRRSPLDRAHTTTSTSPLTPTTSTVATARPVESSRARDHPAACSMPSRTGPDASHIVATNAEASTTIASGRRKRAPRMRAGRRRSSRAAGSAGSESDSRRRRAALVIASRWRALGSPPLPPPRWARPGRSPGRSPVRCLG